MTTVYEMHLCSISKMSIIEVVLKKLCTASSLYWAVLLFSKLRNNVLGYFDPKQYFLIIKIDDFRGDLSGNSAEKEAPMLDCS